MEFPKNFSFKELTDTNTGYDNRPESWEIVETVIATGLKLDKIREKFGNPIRVNCCYRSDAVNRSVGGVSSSAHRLGLAADICAWSGTENENRALYALLVGMVSEIEIDQLILYTKVPGDKTSEIRFMHVGFRSGKNKPRKQLLFK